MPVKHSLAFERGYVFFYLENFTMRKKLFNWHSKLALLAMLPLLVICVTGSILVFKPELDQLLLPERASLQHFVGERQNLDELYQLVQTRFDNHHIGTWELFDDHRQADRVYLIKNGTAQWSTIYLDPYKGKVLSDPVALDHYLTDWLVELHYTLLLGVFGTVAGLIFSVILLFLGISGIVLHRKFWRKLFTLRWDKSLLAGFSDLHKMVGIWASPALLILAFTGGYWNAAEVLEESTHDHEQVSPPEAIAQHISLVELKLDAQIRVDGLTVTYIVMPYEQGKYISFYGKVPSGNPFNSDYANGVSYSAKTGEKVYQWDVRTSAVLPTFIDSFRTLHFGTFGGLASRIVWAIAGMMPLILSVTGVYLWYRRKAKQQDSRDNRQVLTTNA